MAPAVPKSRWIHHLFGCLDEPALCLSALCFPCFVYGKNMQILENEEHCFPNCVVWMCFACVGCGIFGVGCVGWMGREKIRVKFGIEGDDGEDCGSHLFCHACALVQERKELLARKGARVDPSQAVAAESPYLAQPPPKVPDADLPAYQPRLELYPSQPSPFYG
ncbi:hypothetical protein HDV03_004688 [Kappamyces sp. JEL0829]|nr:hypothetical protein HDV03_004688 [Kappamyces sp. JEL0829]